MAISHYEFNEITFYLHRYSEMEMLCFLFNLVNYFVVQTAVYAMGFALSDVKLVQTTINAKVFALSIIELVFE